MIILYTAHAQSENLEDAREIYADGTYFPNNLCILVVKANKCRYYERYIYSPTDAPVSCPKKTILKFTLKHSPTCFAVTVTPSSRSALIYAY